MDPTQSAPPGCSAGSSGGTQRKQHREGETEAKAAVARRLKRVASGQSLGAQARLYVQRQAASPARYIWEQLLQTLLGGVPTVVGLGLRGIAYRAMLRMNGSAAIEKDVRLRYASHIRLGAGSYLDER